MSGLSEDAAAALRSALNAEHAAVWVYGLASAYGSEKRVNSAVSEALQEHADQRGRAEQALRDAGETPPAAQPAYSVPQPVTDQMSAIRAALTAENDCQVGWRSVLENSEDRQLREVALQGLTTSTTRAARWRITIDEPAAQAFPGQP